MSGRELILSSDGAATRFPYSAVDASLWEYYRAATATAPRDFSAVESDSVSGSPSAALVAAEYAGKFGFFGRSATFELAQDSTARDAAVIGSSTAETLRDRCRSELGELRVQVIGAGAVLTGFEAVLLSAGAAPSTAYSAEVDLTLDEEQLWRRVRRRFRPFINTGRRDLRTETVDADVSDYGRFELYRALHREVAGRETRPQESWDVMFELLREGRGQLVLAYLGERLVAATYVMRFGSIAIYASGAYARDLGKYPVSHWPLYASMLEARRVGVKRFVLGPVFLDADSAATPKERTIGEFKRGFATEVVARREYWLQGNQLM